VPGDQPATVELVVMTAGAYFGEVVRRRLGGRWDFSGDDVFGWRMVLPTGIHFSPAGFVAAAIVQGELDDLDTALDAPPRTKPHLERALERMGEVTVEDFYSLCGRLDTLEHVHEVLVAVAARMLGAPRPGDPGTGVEGEPFNDADPDVDPAELVGAVDDVDEPDESVPATPDEGERLN